jgi:hypothetical protein
VTDLRLGIAIVDYTLKTRRHRDRERFPLTAGWIWHVSRWLGQPVGEHRAYRIQHALIDAAIIEPAGSYPQRRHGLPTGFKVTLYRLVRCALRADTSSVGRARVDKHHRHGPYALSWAHPLFGMCDGRPPPTWTKRQVRERLSLDEWQRGAWE